MSKFIRMENNETKVIKFDSGSTYTDKYIKIQLEQEVKTIEFLSMKIHSKDAYQDFNSDYGVLIGRVIANGGIGIPNAKISIFIPLSDEDIENENVYNIYPYKTPRDKNNEGKRYNLLPRVSTFNERIGAYKPKQPFGSFPTKAEIVTNIDFLNVYKKYYKYSTVTNDYGDYMIFGTPVGNYTVHMSVDITDIGKYSMTPASMIKAGYPANLFTEQGKAIKESIDLNDLPNIETQEVAVNIVPFWGDTTNFVIGITRQDFRIKAVLESSFTIFGTTMTMGETATIGDPDKNNFGLHNKFGHSDFGFYFTSEDTKNNIDIRTYRTATPIVRLYSINETVKIEDIDANRFNPTTQVFELSKSEYFEYLNEGNFVLNVPCNRRKVITNGIGQEVVVDDNSPYGVFTRFYGMMTVEYPDLVITTDFSDKFTGGVFSNNNARVGRGKLKIPQSIGLVSKESSFGYVSENDVWRKEHKEFVSGELYSVAQFLPTRYTKGIADGEVDNSDFIDKTNNTTNIIEPDLNWLGGSFFKVAGNNLTSQNEIDDVNYIINPSGVTNASFKYDFPSNISLVDQGDFFGAQWINMCLIFPQYVWAYREGVNRRFNVADVFFKEYKGSTYFVGNDNNDQILFGDRTNTTGFLRGDAYQTAFINVPKNELVALNSNELIYKDRTLSNVKGINLGSIVDNRIVDINLKNYKYSPPNKNNVSVLPANFKEWGVDNNTYIRTDKSAFIFKGMYKTNILNDLSNLNVI